MDQRNIFQLDYGRVFSDVWRFKSAYTVQAMSSINKKMTKMTTKKKNGKNNCEFHDVEKWSNGVVQSFFYLSMAINLLNNIRKRSCFFRSFLFLICGIVTRAPEEVSESFFHRWANRIFHTKNEEYVVLNKTHQKTRRKGKNGREGMNSIDLCEWNWFSIKLYELSLCQCSCLSQYWYYCQWLYKRMYSIHLYQTL